MLQENVVQVVELMHEGKAFSAPYYVENGIVHAHIDGRNMVLPMGRTPVETNVASVLRAALERRDRRAGFLSGVMSRKPAVA